MATGGAGTGGAATGGAGTGGAATGGAGTGGAATGGAGTGGAATGGAGTGGAATGGTNTGGAGTGGAGMGGAGTGGAGTGGAGTGGACPAGTALQNGACRATVVEIDAAYAYTCALLSNGQVWCWGTVPWISALPADVPRQWNVARRVDGVDTAISFRMADSVACVLLEGGVVRCLGIDSDGQLGDGQTAGVLPLAAPVNLGEPAVDVAPAGNHTCAVLASGGVRCWGVNAHSELGCGQDVYGLYRSSSPVPVVGISSAVAVGSGPGNSCAVLADGSVQCWGSNYTLALGATTPGESATPLTVAGVTNARSLVIGEYQVCALLAGAGLRCWGGNSSGQLGNGGYTDSATPVIPTGVSGVVALSAGLLYTCAASPTAAWCWGTNTFGQIGTGQRTPAYVPTPAAVIDIGGTRRVAAGTYHTCALTSQGEVKCWGSNLTGALGNESAGYYSYTPVNVTATW